MSGSYTESMERVLTLFGYSLVALVLVFFSRTQFVTQDTTTVISGDVDPTECTNLAGPLVSFIAHPYTITLFPGHLRTSPNTELCNLCHRNTL